MTAHTSGPWVVNKDRRGAGKLYVREAKLSEVAGATAGRAVAQVTAVVGSDEQMANALLMASAPDLLQAVRALLVADVASQDYATDLGQRAVAKAEGLEP